MSVKTDLKDNYYLKNFKRQPISDNDGQVQFQSISHI